MSASQFVAISPGKSPTPPVSCPAELNHIICHSTSALASHPSFVDDSKTNEGGEVDVACALLPLLTVDRLGEIVFTCLKHLELLVRHEPIVRGDVVGEAQILDFLEQSLFFMRVDR